MFLQAVKIVYSSLLYFCGTTVCLVICTASVIFRFSGHLSVAQEKQNHMTLVLAGSSPHAPLLHGTACLADVPDGSSWNVRRDWGPHSSQGSSLTFGLLLPPERSSLPSDTIYASLIPFAISWFSCWSYLNIWSVFCRPTD